MTFEGIDDTVEAELLRDHIVCYRIDGALFFGAAQRFLTELTAVTDVKVVILRLPDLQMLDATGAQALSEIVAELEARGITVLLKGPRPEHLRLLGTVGALDRLAHENHLFTDLDAAVAHAGCTPAVSPATSPALPERVFPDLLPTVGIVCRLRSGGVGAACRRRSSGGVAARWDTAAAVSATCGTACTPVICGPGRGAAPTTCRTWLRWRACIIRC